jgi:hypothetical protein
MGGAANADADTVLSASARPRLFQRFMMDAPFVGAPPDRTLSDRCDRQDTRNTHGSVVATDVSAASA